MMSMPSSDTPDTSATSDATSTGSSLDGLDYLNNSQFSATPIGDNNQEGVGDSGAQSTSV